MLLKEAPETGNKVYAVVAPSIASQFTYAKLGQVITGLKKLGFHTVVEAALGADMVAQAESQELAEKGFLTSSCCPAFVTYIRKTFPKLADNISHNLSPMAMISRYIKETTPGAKIVFIGPCTAKKMEIQHGQSCANGWMCALTFEELQALFDSRDLDITTMEEDVLDNASYFGRIFARCGGLSDAVAEATQGAGHRFRSQGLLVRRHRGLPHGAAQGEPQCAGREFHRGHGLHWRLHRRRGLPDARRKEPRRGG